MGDRKEEGGRGKEGERGGCWLCLGVCLFSELKEKGPQRRGTKWRETASERL